MSQRPRAAVVDLSETPVMNREGGEARANSLAFVEERLEDEDFAAA
jgi:hypothetical protein